MFAEQNQNKKSHVDPDFYDWIKEATIYLDEPKPCFYCGLTVRHTWFPVTGEHVAHQQCAQQASAPTALN